MRQKRGMSIFALTMIGVGSIFGSGWLFGAGQAARVAGPAALVSWAIGAVIIGLIAMSYAELGAACPASGGMVRYGHVSHGPVLGFVSGWAVWLAVASLVPIEAIASVQYMGSWNFDWAKKLVDGDGLTLSGMFAAAVLTVALWLLCYWSVALLAKANTVLTVVKFVIPLVVVGALLASGFHTENFSSASGGFAPYGWSAVLTAVTTSGVVFAYNGFQSVVNLGGECRNPGRAIPIALIGSILIGFVLYAALQISFLGAVPTEMLADAGWQGVDFSSPFTQLATIIGLHWVTTVLYFGAFISPAGSGLAYVASSAFMVKGLSETGFFPKKLGEVHPRFGVPRAAMWFNLAFAMLLLFLSGSWGALAGIISAAMVVSYLMGPIAMGVLRRTQPGLHRPFKLPAARVLGPLTFALASCALYWSQWPTTGKVVAMTLVAVPVAAAVLWRTGRRDLVREFAPVYWLVAYLVWMALLSFLGSSDFGGRGVIPGGWDMLVVAVSAVPFYLWAVQAGVRAARDGVATPPPLDSGADDVPAQAREHELSTAR